MADYYVITSLICKLLLKCGQRTGAEQRSSSETVLIL